MNKLNIFVSSTCYDLSQIRSDMKNFIDNSGNQAILSEYDNFPVDPSSRTVENCLEAVQRYADILVLIVGNRYGNTLYSGKSITNTEYLTAKEKGIPIYIFIDKKTLAYAQLWKKNKQIDYSDFVDSTKIFEFITDIRSDSKLWTFEFEKAQDIISIFKIQLSYLFKESLRIRSKYLIEIDELFQKKLSNKALKLILEKNDYYEFSFFVQCLNDQLNELTHLKMDYEYKIYLETNPRTIKDKDIPEWASQKFSSLTNILNAIMKIFNEVFNKYFEKPGTPSDLKGLYYASEAFGRICKSLLLWTIDISSSSVSDECLNFRDSLANLSTNIIEQTWDFPDQCNREIIKLKSTPESKQPEAMNITTTIEFNQTDLDAYYAAFDDYKLHMNIK